MKHPYFAKQKHLSHKMLCMGVSSDHSKTNYKQMTTRKIVIWVTIFAIAMGFLETSVVVYLRELYYPEGFAFPLSPIKPQIAFTEIWREAATLLMLLFVGIVAGKTKTEKFAYFIYSFAIWDLFYYVFLKLLLNWPESFFTWDVLFLIPVTWVGPVLAPILLSLSMILLAATIIYFTNKSSTQMELSNITWFKLIVGSIIVIVSFCIDYISYILNYYTVKELFTLPLTQKTIELSLAFYPRQFNWWIFGLGQLVILWAIGTTFIKNKRNYSIQLTR